MIRDFVLFDTLFIFCHVHIVSIYDTIKQDWFHVPFFQDGEVDEEKSFCEEDMNTNQNQDRRSADQKKPATKRHLIRGIFQHDVELVKEELDDLIKRCGIQSILSTKQRIKKVIGVILDGEEHPVIDFIHIEKDKGDIKDIRLYRSCNSSGTGKVQRIQLPGRILDIADDVLNNIGTFILLHQNATQKNNDAKESLLISQLQGRDPTTPTRSGIRVQRKDVSLHILRHGQLKEITCKQGFHGKDQDDLALKEVR